MTSASERRRSASWVPRKPAPPVIRIRLPRISFVGIFHPSSNRAQTLTSFWRGSFLSVAPGAQNSRWHTGHNRVLGNIVSHNGTCTHDGVCTYTNAGQYRCVDANVGPIPNEYRFNLKIRRDDRNIQGFGSVTRAKNLG